MKVKDFNLRVIEKKVIDSKNIKVTIFYDEDARDCLGKKKFSECEVELYTGFNDSENNMIYQGDIISAKYPPFNEEGIYLVDWCEDEYILFFINEYNEDRPNQPICNLKLYEEIHILGNRHTGFMIKKGNEYVKAFINTTNDE